MMDMMNTTGMVEAGHLFALFESRAWHTLVPDREHRVIVAGHGEIESIEDGETWRQRGLNLPDRPTEFQRINDAGQVLGYTEFWNPEQTATAGHLILLSPVEVPVSLHSPEPSTILLVVCGLALSARRLW